MSRARSWSASTVALAVATAVAVVATLLTHDPDAKAAAAPSSTSHVKVSGGAFGFRTQVIPLLFPLGLGPAPTVELPADGGGPFTRSAATVGLPRLAMAETLKVTTQGSIAATGAFARSSAEVAKVRVGTLLTIENVSASCNSVASGSTGSASVATLSIGGKAQLDLVPGPNTRIDIAGLGTLILNEHVVSSRAATAKEPAKTSITVNAAHLKVTAGALGRGDLIVAQARCGLESPAVVNNPPDAEDLDIAADEDTPEPVTLAATDPDGDDLEFTTTNPTHGTLSGTGATRTYTPHADYFGTDSFTYWANDGEDDSNVATARITVAEANDAPTTRPDTKSTNQDTVLRFPASELIANDSPGPPNESSQTLTVRTPDELDATKGEVHLDGSSVVYTPKPGHSGDDAFSYTVCDDGTTAASPDPRCTDGTVNVDVRKVNGAPVARDVEVTTPEDTPVDFVLSATDPDGDPLTFTIVDGPVHGEVNPLVCIQIVGENCPVRYTPHPDYFGPVSFTFKANDGSLDSNVATVRIDVAPVNDPPVADPDEKSTAQDTPTSFPASDLTDNDSPGPPNESDQALTVTKVEALSEEEGRVDLVAGMVTYTPKTGFTGNDRFKYTVCDPEGLCLDGVVTVHVEGQPNRPPSITSVPTVSEWMDMTPAAGDRPRPRSLYGAQAYDEVNDRIIVFSGEDNVTPLPRPADVWVLTNASGIAGPPTWVEILPINSGPVGRVVHTTAYDPTANRLIVYGGCADNCGPSLADAWVLTHANGIGGSAEWLRLPDGEPRAGAAAAFDPVANRLIVFGGHNGRGTDVSTVRVLVDANGIGAPRWEPLTATGAPPPPRGEPAVATYDSLTNRLTVFGGFSTLGTVGNESGVLSNANGLGGTPTWSQLNPNGVPPAPRGGVSSVFDPNSGRMISFGGTNPSLASGAQTNNETWVLSGSNGLAEGQWHRISTAGGPPPERAVASIGYHRASNRMVVALGLGDRIPAPSMFNDTWVLTNASGQCTAGQPCNYDVDATDPDVGDSLTYSLGTGPAGLTIDASSGAIDWTPTTSQIGDNAVTVRVVDSKGMEATQNFTLTVAGAVVPNVVGLDPASARALIGAADLQVGTETTLGGGIDLQFNSLPSEQGATYFDTGSPAPESRVFAVDGTTLFQNSMGVGICGAGGNAYAWLGAVDRRLPYRMSLRARVLEEEGDVARNSYGFSFGVATGTFQDGIGLGTNRIADVRNEAIVSDVDTQLFHDYGLEGLPGFQHRLYVDGALLATREPVSLTSQSYAFLGDGTCGTNARAEVTSFEFVQPRVVRQNPAAGTLVPNRTPVDLDIAEGPGLGLPEARGDSYVADEDAVLEVPPPGVLGNDTDPGGNGLTAVLTQGPVNGSVDLRPDGSFTYTPDADFNGSDPFRYKARNDKGDSNTVAVNVVVREQNDVPTAVVDQKSTRRDVPLPFPAADLTGNDRPGPANEAAQALVVDSVGGRARLENGTVTYTPDPGFTGTDTFPYRICDDGTTAGSPAALCADGTVDVEVKPVNRAPEAPDLNGVIVDEDGGVALTLPATDADGDALTFTIVDGPGHGTLDPPGAGGPARTYTPTTDYNGADTFTFKANDGEFDSNTATVRITVREVNDPPVALADHFSTPQDTPLPIPASDLTANDRPGPPNESAQNLRVREVEPPEHGQAVLDPAGTIAYTPPPGFSGIDRFVYTVCDDGTTAGALDERCASATVEIDVQRGNQPPIAPGVSLEADEDSPKPFNLLATDPDGDALTYEIVSGPTHGVLAPTGPGGADRTYTPDANYNGPDSISYRANDGELDSDIAIVNITVREANDAPTAVSDDKSTDQDTAVTFPTSHLTANDSAGPANESAQTLAVTGVMAIPGPTGTQGTVSHDPVANTITFTPKAGFTGDDIFAYRICDDGTTAGAPAPMCANGIVTVDVVATTTAPLVAIEVNPDGVLLDPTQTRPFQAQATYADGAVVDVTARVAWSTADNSVATIAPSGVATAVAYGTTSVNATLGGVMGTTGLSVGGAQVISIVVEPAAAVVVESQTQAFVARGIHADGTSELLQAPGLGWSTSNPAVATISPAGLATTHGPGDVTVTATLGAVTGTAALSVRAAVPNSSVPTVAITSPADGATVTEPTEIRGTATDTEFVKYVLEIAPAGETTFTPIVTSTTPVIDGVLGTLDPTLLINDLYLLRLTAVDAGGNPSDPAEITVQVDREQKVGNFTVGFDDLTVPLSGIDVTVTRTYDSRDKAVGDFGVGWRLGVRDVRLRKTGGTLGANWVGTRQGSGLSTVYCVDPGRNRTVALTMPGGEVLHFEASVEAIDGSIAPGRPNCTRLAPPNQMRIVWRPAEHTFGTLAAADLSSTVFVEGSFPAGSQGGVTLYDDQDLTQPYDPRRFLAGLRDGTAFTVTDRSDVERIADPNGNAITITRDGITHSSGPGVIFERDAQGRITAVVDPDGRRITYAYDANGDLAARTDREGNVTRFAYDHRHNLIQIIDPLGRTGVRNEYDPSGRLIKVTDADGRTVELSHDLTGDTEQVRDRRGNLSIFTYDSDGNVTAETNAESETTLHEYDGDGNETATVDGIGRRTERTFDANRNLTEERTPLGRTTRFAYGAFDQVRKTVDPTGRTTVNSYDMATGNLLSATVASSEAAADDPGVADPCRATTTFTYDGAGNVLTQTDPLGNVTTNSYDSGGRLTATADATQATATYDYDDNGNRIRQTDALNRVTRFEYDAENRLTRTIHPDDTSTTTVYDDAGRVEATVDEAGRVTRNTYDAQGRQVRTDHPDGTNTRTGYDENGKLLSAVDQLGRATVTSYDRANRADRVTHPDATFTTTTYDDAGQVIEERDERGNVTATQHDGDGRVETVTRPLGNVSSFTYDGAGQKLTETDANGNTTSFAYDCANRVTTTTYPDNTTRVVAYDLAGRRIAETDQAGKTTRFGYDDVGRLNKVTDALNQDTVYQYDKVGNRTHQTDAKANTTLIAYDARNRERVRSLPGSEATTTEHDSVGNISSKLDANGRLTEFAYDAMNRLTEKIPDPFFAQAPVRFDYTPTGQRESMVDAAGTTNYSYNQRDWLTTKSGPQGTLTYDYEPTGNLESMVSGHAGGAAMTYGHDELNRLSSAADGAGPSGSTGYGYDPVGNLKTVGLPNGVTSAYDYDTLNRLRKLESTGPSGPVAKYEYTLGPAGNRTGVTELSGRTVAYMYDDLYRLKQEKVSADPGGVNGTVDYEYDPVGNRLSRTSTLPGVPSTTATYDENDRVGSETYDDNGNTLDNNEHTFTYDYEDRLTTADGATTTIRYDGDGNKVSETVNGVTTTFLVDDRNPTGYAQVIDELTDGVLTKTYAYGQDLISQRQITPAGDETSYYGYDGHGSVRYLTDRSAAVTDTYKYDAFGITVAAAGSTKNRYLYAGESGESQVGLYYLRARHLLSTRGRFLTTDGHPPDVRNPASVNRYSYTMNDPVNGTDPTGLYTLSEATIVSSIVSIVAMMDFQMALGILSAAAGPPHFPPVGPLSVLLFAGSFAWATGLARLDPTWLNMPACPCTVPDKIFQVGDENENWANSNHPWITWYYHPNADYDLRSKATYGGALEHGQQCCYDGHRKLITDGPSAGTPDFFSPNAGLDSHIAYDVIPFKVLGWRIYQQYWIPNRGNGCPTNYM